MFLVNNTTFVVVASSPKIYVADNVYQASGVNIFKEGVTLHEFDLPPQYEVYWCLYKDDAFTTIPKPSPVADEQTKQAIVDKKEEINSMCEQTITYGVDYTSTSGAGHYSLTKYDQINIKTWGDLASIGKSVPYHADGEDCRMYSSTEFLGLVATVTLNILYNQTYANQLKLQVAEMVEFAEVQTVYYGMNLNTERQEKLDIVIAKTIAELGLPNNETAT